MPKTKDFDKDCPSAAAQRKDGLPAAAQEKDGPPAAAQGKNGPPGASHDEDDLPWTINLQFFCVFFEQVGHAKIFKGQDSQISKIYVSHCKFMVQGVLRHKCNENENIIRQPLIFING